VHACPFFFPACVLSLFLLLNCMHMQIAALNPFVLKWLTTKSPFINCQPLYKKHPMVHRLTIDGGDASSHAKSTKLGTPRAWPYPSGRGRQRRRCDQHQHGGPERASAGEGSAAATASSTSAAAPSMRPGCDNTGAAPKNLISSAAASSTSTASPTTAAGDRKAAPLQRAALAPWPQAGGIARRERRPSISLSCQWSVEEQWSGSEEQMADDGEREGQGSKRDIRS
jgi:hypothetical protein